MTLFKKYIKKYWKLFCLAILCLTVEAACDLIQPAIMSKIIDVGVKGQDIGYVIHFGLLMLLVTAIGALGAVSRNIASSNVSQKFGAELRFDLFKKIQSLSFENLNNFKTSSLITRLTNDVTQVQNLVNGLMRVFVKAPLLCIGSIIMASLLNERMALILAAVVPVVGIIMFLNIKIGYPFFSKVQKGIDRVNSVMREYLTGVRVVKAFNRFSFETARFAESNQELSDASSTAMKVMSVFSPGITFSVNMGIVAVLWIGGNFVNTGNFLVGEVIAFVNYMTQILTSLMIISNIINAFIRARTSKDRIEEVMLQENAMYRRNEANQSGGAFIGETGLKPQNGFYSGVRNFSVEFDHVYFKYANASGDPVLRDITFSCRPGETLGIIGSTGSGKSSLINLIPRFYDVTDGCVKVNGTDVRQQVPGILRESISVVPQKTILFTGTILENIKWGCEGADGDEVIKAAAAAQAHDFIAAFPEGYNTVLGQGGVNLSGGQKQRIAIARALVKKPEILILDDCTSAVDIVTEARIRQAIKEYFKNTAAFVITQRISSVMDADRILVLENGRLAGLGTHKELMAGCEVYREICCSQTGEGRMQHG